MSFTVTATQSGSTASGMLLRVKVLTGAASAASQNGQTASQSGTAAHQASITPNATGSIVYGSVYNVGTTALTANGSTTLFDNVTVAGLKMGTLRATSTSSSGVAETIGCSAPANGGLLALAEILPNGTIAEDASGPAPQTNSSGNVVTSPSFTPPGGSLLTVMVTSNGASGVDSVAITDTSGLSLTWITLLQVHPSASGVAGVWVAQMPAARTTTASLTVTPSFTAQRVRGRFRTGSLSVSPSFTAQRVRGRFRTGSLPLSPSFSAARVQGHTRTGSLAITPSFSAARVQGHTRHGSLALSPSFLTGFSRVEPVPVGSWYGLLSVLRHSEAEFDAYNSRPPLSCPQCGEPLTNSPSTKSGSGVQLFCKYDGWQHPRDHHPDIRLGGGGY